MRIFAPLTIVVAVVLLQVPAWVQAAEIEALGPLHQISFVTALSFVGDDQRLEAAGSEGLLWIDENLQAQRPGRSPGVLMSLAHHPNLPGMRYAGGYKGKKTGLGFLVSEDDGASWQRRAKDGDRALAFHALAVAPSAPATIYGFAMKAGLRLSQDNGRTWRAAGKLPAEAFDLAVAPADPRTVYAATRAGLFASSDGGASWQRRHPAEAPATFVNAAAGGRLTSSIYRHGLVRSDDAGRTWSEISTGYQDRALMDLVADPIHPRRLYAIADTGGVMVSTDAGRSWLSIEGWRDQVPERIEAGRQIFEENCQACHGEKGRGEKPDDIHARDQNGLPVAPPLDDSGHGWHHSDVQLIHTIHEGSPRNERMIAWKDVLDAEAVRNVVAYVKSLWSFRSRACQGRRHMRCMH